MFFDKNSIENVENSVFLQLFQREKAILILDNDGTIFDSQPAEAWRIQTLLANLGETELPEIKVLLEIGYGQKTWADGLVSELKKRYPALADHSLEQLKDLLKNSPVDEVIVGMGQHMNLIAGAREFLVKMNQKGHQVAICSDNYADTVAEAINHHIHGIHCQLPDNREPHPSARKKTNHPDDCIITLNDTMGVNLKGKRKPDPTKLLIQQFKSLVHLGVADLSQRDQFIADSTFRCQLKSHENYRKTIYIGDDINDYLAAVNANFDCFVASTNSGKCDASKFTEVFTSNPSSTTEAMMFDNLQALLNQLDFITLGSNVSHLSKPAF